MTTTWETSTPPVRASRRISRPSGDSGRTETQLAGHPVVLSVLLDGGGVVRGIRALTDPKAGLYLKKKAFLLGVRVKGRYGREDWACRENAPPGDRTPVGGMFIDEICEKDYNGRRLVLHTELYRAPGQDGREFTDRTRFEILGPATG